MREDIILTPEDIVFADSGDEDNAEVNEYLCATLGLDAIAGLTALNSDMEDIITVNYYGVYNYLKNSFRVDCCVTVWEDMEKFAQEFPELSVQIERYINNNTTDISIDMTLNQNAIVFERFKEYVLYDYDFDGTFEEWAEERRHEWVTP